VNQLELTELIKKAQIALISEKSEPIKAQIAALPILSLSDCITQPSPDKKPIIPKANDLKQTINNTINK
jgi:hypothetical protein